MTTTKTRTRTRTRTAKASKAKVHTTTAMSAMADAFKRWAVKPMGAKPSTATVDAAAALLKRTGTGKHLALAMYMRPGGATQAEVIHATGDTQINAYYDAVRSKALAAVTDNAARGGHKVYALALPVKKASKPRTAKGKASKAETPATDTEQAS